MVSPPIRRRSSLAGKNPSGGTAVYLPSVDEPAALILSKEPASELPSGTEIVLVVEDDAQVRSLVGSGLRNAGYTVLEAADSDEAVRHCEQSERSIDLLLTDVVMPVLSGPELVEKVGSLRDGTKVLYMTGYAGDAIVRHRILKAGSNLLQKPFTPQELARKVRAVLDEAGRDPE